jgi:hypothetical protein
MHGRRTLLSVTDPPSAEDGDAGVHSDPDQETSSEPQPTTPARRSASGANPSLGMPVVDPSLWPSIRAAEQIQTQLGNSVARMLSNAGAFTAIEEARARWLEATQIPTLRIAEMIAQISTGPSLFAGTLAAQLADARLALLTSITLPDFRALHDAAFQQLSLTSRFVEQQSAALAAMSPQLEVARSVSNANRAWERVIKMSRPNVEISLAHVRMTGRGTAGVVEAGVLLTERDDLLVERFRAEASVAIGPAGEYEDLRVGLAAVHPDLPNRIDGAWERIRGGGADAAGQAANSLMEAVDWTLRLLAPDDDVLAWHASENRPDSELHMGKPTRPLRLRYVAVCGARPTREAAGTHAVRQDDPRTGLGNPGPEALGRDSGRRSANADRNDGGRAALLPRYRVAVGPSVVADRNVKWLP